MDEKGNVYVADTSNFAIRKIGEAGLQFGSIKICWSVSFIFYSY